MPTIAARILRALDQAGLLGKHIIVAGTNALYAYETATGKAKAVTATRVEASAEVPGHPVGDSTDGLSNRYWGAPGPGAALFHPRP